MLSPATTASTATHRRSVEFSRCERPRRRGEQRRASTGTTGLVTTLRPRHRSAAGPGIVTDRTCPPSDSDEDPDEIQLPERSSRIAARPPGGLDPTCRVGCEHRNLACSTPLHRNVEQAILQLFHQSSRGSTNLLRPSIALARHRGDEHPGHAQPQRATLRHLDRDALHGGTLGRSDDNPFDVTTGQRGRTWPSRVGPGQFSGG